MYARYWFNNESLKKQSGQNQVFTTSDIITLGIIVFWGHYIADKPNKQVKTYSSLPKTFFSMDTWI